ncbi:MAG: hypothetical protein QM760_07180 [Nibricoccus sp.]
MSTEPTFTQRLDELEKAFKGHPPIRAVNFHSSSPVNREAYDRQLEQYARNFSSVNEAEMREYLTTGQ